MAHNETLASYQPVLKSVCVPPAAWTTRPRVVVILEEATLADSGSKPLTSRDDFTTRRQKN